MMRKFETYSIGNRKTFACSACMFGRDKDFIYFLVTLFTLDEFRTHYWLDEVGAWRKKSVKEEKRARVSGTNTPDLEVMK